MAVAVMTRLLLNPVGVSPVNPLPRRTALSLLAVAGLVLAGGAACSRESNPAGSRIGPPDPAKAEEIRAEFLHAWNGYQKFAWGHDEVLPVSGGHAEFFAEGHPIGLSIIEALDTHWVMGLDDEVAASVDWITANLNFDIDADFYVFEAIIRLVGGLLAGHLVTGNRVLLDKCVDLTDRLLPAFAKSPTGIPYTHVNLHTGTVSGNTPSLAHIGSNIVEFGVLSQLTGDQKYYQAAKRAYREVISRRSALDLLGTSLNVETGEWIDTVDRAPDQPDDSFYEYLWGGWAMFGDHECLDWFRMFDSSWRKHKVERVDGLLWFKQIDFRTGAVVDHWQTPLAVCILDKSDDIALASDCYKSWTAVQDKYAVIPEKIDYTTLAVLDPRGKLRPEYPNCAFDLYCQTGDPFYRTTSWKYFQNLKTYHRVENGYTVLADVTTRPMTLGDRFPAYSFAENFKWLYLTFSGTPRFDYDHGYLSTEGKILRGFTRPRSK
jgi:hypothetical protein